MWRNFFLCVLLAAVIIVPAFWWRYSLIVSRSAAPQKFAPPKPAAVERTILVPTNENPDIPEYWEKRQINGMDYYIMPVSA